MLIIIPNSIVDNATSTSIKSNADTELIRCFEYQPAGQPILIRFSDNISYPMQLKA